MDFYGLEGHKDLARDPDTNAVVNVNTLEYQQYLSRRNVKTEKNYKVQNMEQELANMKGDIDEIKFSTVTSKGSDFVDQHYFVYPNPAENSLFIANVRPADNGSIKIYDVLGKEVLNERLSSNVNISNLPKGMYSVELHTTDGTAMKKFIKR